jgi:hypothetical protein
MPIRPELRHFYRGPDYEATRARIQQRAKNRCEQCGKPNHRRVWVMRFLDYFRLFPSIRLPHTRQKGDQFWSSVKGDGQKWRSCTHRGCRLALFLHGGEWAIARRIRVVCTLAHLNHTPGDDRDENLKFLCQWCHLHYDQLHHKETRSIRKDSTRPLLQEAS